ncbi:UvrB/UvrC motif-containing protein [Tautonia sociabilis]|uniref:Excinuclease ABC subunit B n=1 Tax=Tautonia sociabilis TaxID=2080755 RepID=A0A432MGJ8_9BACT|nr:UvrB/UvrC motif-containing protein [Tautonia sociabilis]RUL85907.1 excinuclease ABC subunit B [Tautonia sociabilis]
MKCQKCSKPATYHITDLDPEVPGKFAVFHFCDEHALQHLAPAASKPDSLPVGQLAKDLVSGSSASREPSPADSLSCPNCQISFAEFRSTGRLGCPYDYEAFRDELMPLLENIHGEVRHSGKAPKRAPRTSRQQNTLIRLRNDLKRAIAAEDYEAAAKLRDEIKSLEQEQGR